MVRRYRSGGGAGVRLGLRAGQSARCAHVLLAASQYRSILAATNERVVILDANGPSLLGYFGASLLYQRAEMSTRVHVVSLTDRSIITTAAAVDLPVGSPSFTRSHHSDGRYLVMSEYRAIVVQDLATGEIRRLLGGRELDSVSISKAQNGVALLHDSQGYQGNAYRTPILLDLGFGEQRHLGAAELGVEPYETVLSGDFLLVSGLAIDDGSAGENDESNADLGRWRLVAFNWRTRQRTVTAAMEMSGSVMNAAVRGDEVFWISDEYGGSSPTVRAANLSDGLPRDLLPLEFSANDFLSGADFHTNGFVYLVTEQPDSNLGGPDVAFPVRVAWVLRYHAYGGEAVTLSETVAEFSPTSFSDATVYEIDRAGYFSADRIVFLDPESRDLVIFDPATAGRQTIALPMQ